MNDLSGPSPLDDVPPDSRAGSTDDLMAELSRRVQQLQTALRSRAVIEQATGLLMHREGLRADEASTRLRQLASQQDAAVGVLARRVVDEGSP